jgi:amino acid transporter
MSTGRGPRKISLLALIAVTYCIVSGGPYGLEEIVQKSGYGGALLILLVTPLVWSLPTTLMVSELGAAIPEEGGFYTWVRRAMGPFWGFQEAWLTLAGSIFDMAIYPTLCAAYLAKLWPQLGTGVRPVLLGGAMIVACVGWNLMNPRAVGRGSIAIAALILAPFVVIVGLALAGTNATPGAPLALGHLDLFGGVVIAMWNYMGWDNSSTVAEEVDRPRRAYPAAMTWALGIVVATYVIPVLATARAGVGLELWEAGGWVSIARALGGGTLAACVMLAGAASATGTFNALTLSLSRLPMVMAEDGYLPRAFAYRHPRTGVPVVALLVCAATWTACLGIGFDRTVMLDVLLSGLSMLLEFYALVILRVREPGLPRPFRVPGGLAGAVALCIGPTALIAISIVRTREDSIGRISALWVGVALIALGPLLYALRRKPAGAVAQAHR